MVLRLAVVVPFALLSALAQAPLRVEPDGQNPVAAGIAGAWRLDPELGRRLGPAKSPAEVTFRTDATVLDRLPAGAAATLAGRRVFAAGSARVRDRDDLWVLTERAGCTEMLVFRAGATAAARPETLVVVLVRGAAPPADLLFVCGDPGRQPYSAYARVPEPGALTPAAAITEMARLLEADRHVEFLRTWLLPTDLARLQDGGRSLEACAAQFAERKAAEVLEALRAAAKRTPVVDDAAGEAVYTGEGLPRPLRLQRVGTRWYLANR